MGNVTFLGIPAWIPEIILPVIFGLMALRFGLRSFKNLSMTMRMGKKSDQGGKT